MAPVTKTIFINAPIDAVFAVVHDFTAYPEFLPEVQSTRVHSKKTANFSVDFEISVVQKIAYTIDVTWKAPRALEWHLRESASMKQNDGKWILRAASATTTEATYSLEVTMRGLMPKFITDSLVATTLPATLNHFKTRAENMYALSQKKNPKKSAARK